jgi:hypothetical protein
MKSYWLGILFFFIFSLTQVRGQEIEATSITCKPQFEKQIRPELHVTDQNGNERDAFRQWLVLEDGKTRFRIPWGSPPLSHPPSQLRPDQVYTFLIKATKNQRDFTYEVIRVSKDNKVIYESQKP